MLFIKTHILTSPFSTVLSSICFFIGGGDLDLEPDDDLESDLESELELELDLDLLRGFFLVLELMDFTSREAGLGEEVSILTSSSSGGFSSAPSLGSVSLRESLADVDLELGFGSWDISCTSEVSIGESGLCLSEVFVSDFLLSSDFDDLLLCTFPFAPFGDLDLESELELLLEELVVMEKKQYDYVNVCLL